MAIHEYELSTKSKVEICGIVISKLNAWMSYSPDGIIVKDGKPVTLIEVKCPYEGRTNNISSVIKNLKFINVNDNNTLNFNKKHSYYGQVQMGMAILNVSFTHFVIFASFDKSFVIMNILFDEEYAVNMLTTVKKSYFNHMLHFLCTTDKHDNDENIL